jgi:hypothetical protein
MIWMKPRSYWFTQLSVFLHVPAKSAIYALHNSNRCIYIGESDNLRKTLQQHLRGDNPWISVWEPSGVYFELWPETGRYERKIHLIAEFQPLLTDAAGECPGLSAIGRSDGSTSSYSGNEYER